MEGWNKSQNLAVSIGLSNVSPSSSFAVQKVEEAALSKKKKEPLDFERAQLELKVEYDRKAAGVNKHQSTPAKLARESQASKVNDNKVQRYLWSVVAILE